MSAAAGERPRVAGPELEWAAIDGVLATLNARGLHDPDRVGEVVALATGVAERLELDEALRADVAKLAALHDVGLIGILDAIVDKPSPLTAEERILLCRHPLIASSMLSSLGDLARLAPYLLHEHEQWDGAGYPDGLTGEEIPLPSRILLACNAYVAMLRPRPDRPALGEETAAAVLARNAGTQFCPRTVRALLDVAHAEPAPAPAPRARRSAPLRRRLGLRGFLAAAVLGAAAGLLWALPVADVGTRCPSGTGHGYCVLQKAWMPALIEVLACILVAVALATLIFVTFPRWRRGELRRHRSPWPDRSDRLLTAASWTLTFDDAHDRRPK